MLTTSRKTRKRSERKEVSEQDASAGRELTPDVQLSKIEASEHFVQFYEADEFLLDAVSEFVGAGLGAGAACIVIATKPHREGLEERLMTIGLDLAVASERGTYLAQDAAETLSLFMMDGMPDPERFFEVIGGLIERMGKGQRRVRIFGEMVAQLWSEGNQKAAIRLEALWNELYHTTHAFTLFCAYPMHGFAGRDTCSNSARFASSTPTSSLMKATPCLPARKNACAP
jgi:hypothetical protein